MIGGCAVVIPRVVGSALLPSLSNKAERERERIANSPQQRPRPRKISISEHYTFVSIRDSFPWRIGRPQMVQESTA